ncbi:MAG: hemolysin family protein [Odoribacteraceae bacterium]|jgi:putative hemolysin|nr:hemolysin family protein [Odoribacteraceae bacterium]
MEVIILLGLIVFNGLLSMSGMALVSARKSRLEMDARRGSKAAERALKLARNPDKFLSTVQIGITLTGILTGLYSGEAFAGDLARAVARVEVLEPHAVTIAKITIVVVVTYLTLVLGELLPKRWGTSAAERVVKAMVKPMNLLSFVATPFVWLLSRSALLLVKLFRVDQGNDEGKVTEEEIKAIIQEGYDDGEVQAVEQHIVGRVFNLGDRDVGSIMTHRNDLVWLDIRDDVDRVREKVQENLFNIYPVISGSFDNMLGVVYLKDLFVKIDSPDFSLAAIVRPAHYLPENLSVYTSLEQFKKARVKYSLITDEFGDILGIVTLKDILEALIGEVPEAGEEPEIIVREDGSWLVDGQYSFYNFLEYFHVQDLYIDNEYNTLSGLILDLLQHVPVEGERLAWSDFTLEVVDMDGARIDKVLVTRRDGDCR